MLEAHEARDFTWASAALSYSAKSLFSSLLPPKGLESHYCTISHGDIKYKSMYPLDLVVYVDEFDRFKISDYLVQEQSFEVNFARVREAFIHNLLVTCST